MHVLLHFSFRTECHRIARLGRTCALLWVVSVGCWAGDFFLCDVWQNISFPYLHCMWHILVFVSAYTACVLFSYFDAQNECPEMGPVLRYWPKDTWVNFGVPYVTLKSYGIKPIDWSILTLQPFIIRESWLETYMPEQQERWLKLWAWTYVSHVETPPSL